jgi:NAD(P)-dependent dehydrogenase (short-subunit alcohol dehydrogenase family)
MPLFDLTGKVAVITGSTKGIGLGIAQEMVALGAKVVVSSRDQDLCDTVSAEINREQGSEVAKGLACDIADLDSIARFIERAPALWGGVDMLVCNAAILPYIGPSAQTPPELFNKILVCNVHHNFRLAQGLRGEIKKRGGGSITFIGSESGFSASPFVLAYAAAKAAVAHMALCLADEMAIDDIRVNCVAPGLIRSFSSSSTLGDAGLEASGSRSPLGRVGEPRDVAGAVIYLASAAGSHITGSSIIVDGGASRLSSRDQKDQLEAVSGKTYD